MPYTFTLPIRTVNPLNTREHWAKRAKRSKSERESAYWLTPEPYLVTSQRPVIVFLERVGKRKMDDDGLSASFKAIRDGIASKLGIDDGSEDIRFVYSQRVYKRYYVEVTIG